MQIGDRVSVIDTMSEEHGWVGKVVEIMSDGQEDVRARVEYNSDKPAQAASEVYALHQLQVQPGPDSEQQFLLLRGSTGARFVYSLLEQGLPTMLCARDMHMATDIKYEELFSALLALRDVDLIERAGALDPREDPRYISWKVKG